MRAHFLSLVLVFCTLLASQAAPIDSHVAPIDSRELSSRKAKAVFVAKKIAPKPVAKKVAPKPVAKKVAAKPLVKAPAKVAAKPVAKKVAAKPAAKKVAAKPVAKPAAKKAPVAAKKPTAVAKKPAAKPPVKAPAKKPVTAKKPAAKAPAKKAGTVAKKPAAKPPVSKKPVKAAPKPVLKPPTASKGTACPIRKKGSKAGVKARVNSDTEDCGASPAEICAEIDDCATCVSPGLGCAFDVKGGRCVVAGTADLTLATSKKTCDTLVAAEKSSASPAVDVEVTKVAQKAFSLSVQNHIFKGTPNKKNSGRHMLTVWTTDNPTSKENKRDKATGVVEFQNGKGIKDIKTVWNDKDTGDGTFVYDEDKIKTLCLRGYEQSILVNPSNQATLKPPATQPAASTSKKGKGKAPPPPAALKIISGLNNGFVVHNQFINKNVCINISSESCFPLGTGTASGEEGDSCTGDDGVAD